MTETVRPEVYKRMALHITGYTYPIFLSVLLLIYMDKCLKFWLLLIKKPKRRCALTTTEGHADRLTAVSVLWVCFVIHPHYPSSSSRIIIIHQYYLSLSIISIFYYPLSSWSHYLSQFWAWASSGRRSNVGSSVICRFWVCYRATGDVAKRHRERYRVTTQRQGDSPQLVQKMRP